MTSLARFAHVNGCTGLIASVKNLSAPCKARQKGITVDALVDIHIPQDLEDPRSLFVKRKSAVVHGFASF